MAIYSFLSVDEKIKAISMELKSKGFPLELKKTDGDRFSFEIGGKRLTCSYNEAMAKPDKFVSYVRRKTLASKGVKK